MPPVCAFPRLKPKAFELIQRIESESDDVLLIGSCCEEIQTCFKKGQNRNNPAIIPQCFYMVTNRTLVDNLIIQGAYVMTPGWLKNWRQKLSEWGFDQQTARDFFHESATRLTLLDTGVDPRSASRLAGFGAYLNLPTEIIPVGLDFFDLFFSKAISESSFSTYRQETESTRVELLRQAADSAMAVDLLIQLTRAQSEEQATEQIIDIFSILFSPGLINYYAINENTDTFRNESGMKINHETDLLTWVNTRREEYSLTGTGDGFFLRFSHQNKTVGVLHLGDFKVPAHKEQYLNLSLSIAPLCGLAISNTRIFQKLEEAEKKIRREKETSETLRFIMAELSSRLDLKGVQDKLLRSLFLAIPCSHAAIFILDSNDGLAYAVGMQAAEGNELLPYTPRTKTIENGRELLRGKPIIINHEMENPIINRNLAEEDDRAWLGVPFKSRGELKGMIIIGSREPGAFGEEQVSLASIIVDESSVAMDNARLFTQVQKMAVTDSLTGLVNRRHFYELSDKELKRSIRYHHNLSVIMVDIDYFKRVNDTYGHPVGDAVLIEVAACFVRNVRETDIVGRYGGEEFVILLPETEPASAQSLAERLRSQVENLQVPSRKGHVRITVSLGIASKNTQEVSLEELLDQSDKALYKAKNDGRNCVRSFMQE